MSSQQVSMKWNNFSLNMTKNIDELWKDESLVDVSIYCEGQCIQAHKIILSAASPLFRDIFSVNPCKHPVIILQDVAFRELMSLMTFIYKGEISVAEDDLPDLFKAARTLKIPGLSDTARYEEECRKEKNDRLTKKRKLETPVDNIIESTNETNVNEESCSKYEPEIMPKEEPNDFVATCFEENIKDEIDEEEDMKMDDSFNDSSQLYPTDSGGSHDYTWYVTSWGETPNYSTFLCPFCSRSYSCWGYRRRHIMAVHNKSEEISCRWCPTETFTQNFWIEHMLSAHNLNENEAKQAINILNEAFKVLDMKNNIPTLSVPVPEGNEKEQFDDPSKDLNPF